MSLIKRVIVPFTNLGLMESLVWELEEYSGIKTTTVYPYQVDNDMFAGCRVRYDYTLFYHACHAAQIGG